jgi:uncharacterized membrane protein
MSVGKIVYVQESGLAGRSIGRKGEEMSDEDTLMVLAASYDNVGDAEMDYDAVLKLYDAAGTSHDFDAAVIDRDDEGKVKVVKRREEPTQHGAAVGLGVGLAVGAVVALFPAVALVGGLVVGGAAGAALGAVTGHVSEGLDRDDLKELGEVLDKGRAGLIIVYESNLADQIVANIKAGNKFVSKKIDADLDDLTKQIADSQKNI